MILVRLGERTNNKMITKNLGGGGGGGGWLTITTFIVNHFFPAFTAVSGSFC